MLLVFSKWQKIQYSGPIGSIGKDVEFDPKNVCTKFHVNWTYGIILKWKKQLFFYNSAPIRPIGVKLLGQHLHTTSKQGAKFHVSTIYHLTGICENISEEKE